MSLPEISAAQQIMRLAITGQQHLDSLIGYYRSEIDNYNDQRAQWILKYDSLKDNASNKYILQQELDQSKNKINKFEADLNTIKANLNKERQKYFEMIEVNQVFKNKVEEHKQKYRDIVAVCKPIQVSNSVISEKNQQKVRKSKNQNEKNSSRNASRLNQSQGFRQGNGELELELINLGREHDQRKAPVQQLIATLKDQLDDMISQHNQRGQNSSNEYKEALEALAETQSKIMLLTSQYFKLRMNSYQEQRLIQEQNQILRLKAVSMAKKLQTLQESHSEQFKTVDKEVKQRNKAYKQKYDEQLRKKEEHLSILKEQNERINNIYLMKLKKLQGELIELNQKQKVVDEKGKVELSSLKSQIKILKGRIERKGVKEMREQMLQNQEDEDYSSESLESSEIEQVNQIKREVDELKNKI